MICRSRRRWKKQLLATRLTVNVLLHRELIVEKHSEVADNTCRLQNDVVDTLELHSSV